ncbi:jg1352 [Pararge aegeria aegeria]|uniref:Jg1352 protein n=1 Tax=Pararge aegeria aegeria TaxID=348720 RepID=A0A8S4RZW3_9NEOP|nr:jg1352 [Pararge aegeria aegeria]
MTEDMSAAQIQKKTLDAVALITSIATKSTNLKGTFVREIKNAASSVKEAIEVLSSRTISEETWQLQADNARLQAEMASLREELATLRGDMEKSQKQGPASSPPDMTERGCQRPWSERFNQLNYGSPTFDAEISICLISLIDLMINHREDKSIKQHLNLHSYPFTKLINVIFLAKPFYLTSYLP